MNVKYKNTEDISEEEFDAWYGETEFASCPLDDCEDFQRKKGNLIWDTGRIDRIGEFLFSFDKKTVFNFWTDYPQKLTKEQIEIFKREKPELARLKEN